MEAMSVPRIFDTLAGLAYFDGEAIIRGGQATFAMDLPAQGRTASAGEGAAVHQSIYA